MNAFSIDLTAWLSDFYLLSTILLVAVLVAGKVVKQPARRIAISWSAALGLVALTALCAAPDWSTIHMSRPAPLPAVVVSLPSPPPVEFAVAEQPLPEFEMPLPEKIAQPVTVLPAKPVDLKRIILPLMTSGSVAILLWLVAGAWQAKSLRRRAVPASSALKTLLHELSPDEKATPRLAVLGDLPVAVALGVRRPMILLPQSLADLSQPTKVRSVLAHELAHVQHRDLWFLALHRALLVVLWAHPLVWIWRRQVRLDQETLADAAAAEVISRADYAGQLVAMARETATVSRRLPLASSVGLWESPSQLKQRVAVLLDEKLTILRSCTRRWRFFSVLTLSVFTLGLSLVTFQPEKVATAETHNTEESTFGTTMKLNNGATVELLGIGTHGTNANRWWDAEGRPLKDLPFKAVQANNIFPLPSGQLVFRVQGHDQDSDIKWKTLPATNTGEGSVIVDGKKNPRGYYHHAFILPENDGIFSLRVGVATGEWLTVAKGISSAHGRLGMSVVFSRAFSDNAGSAVVIVSLDAFNHREVASRCIAIDKKGKEHIATSHGGTSAGEQNQTQWTFKGLKTADVEEFALQTRPYEWAEFGGLPAGQLSETIAVTDTPASSQSEDDLKFQVRDVNRITSESSNWHYASPPSDSDDDTNRAVLKPSTSSAIPSNSIIQARQQFLKRLHGMGMEKPNNIFGICMDEKGQPLAGVSIQVYIQRVSRPEENSRSILETISDAKGEFVFKNVVNVAKEFPEGLPEEYFQGPEANTLTLQGQVKGRVTYISFGSPADIARGSSAHVCVMPPAKVLRGRVTNKEGQPVAGAEIAVGLDAIRRNGLGGNSTTTNTNGEYVIDGLPSEDLVGSNQAFFVKHPKYAVRRARMVKIPDKLDMQLVPGSVIEGAVQLPEDETNTKPLAGSLVHLRRVWRSDEQMIDHFGYQVEKTAIDKNGHFRFESLPAGKYQLTADIEGWVTQGIKNVEVAQGETTTAPDILLTRGGRVRVQLVDDQTGESMRFKEPTKGYLHPRQQPQRAGIFTSKKKSIVEFSTEGICEIQLLAGQYSSFLVSIPLTDSSSRISVLPDDPDEWPTYEVFDGELLEISSRMKVQKRPKANLAWGTLGVIASPASDDDEAEKKKPVNSFIPETPVAESPDQEKYENGIFYGEKPRYSR